MKQLYTIACIVFVTASLIYGSLQWQEAPTEEASTDITQLNPDFVAKALNTQMYNEKGDLAHNIQADKMEHYTSLEITHFENPKYTLYPKDKNSPWHISAQTGTLDHSQRVRLENRVLLVATDQDSLIQEVHGKYFELDLNSNIISSDQTIMILGKGFTMYGSGLIVDLNTTQMTLTEHVQTIYKKNPS